MDLYTVGLKPCGRRIGIPLAQVTSKSWSNCDDWTSQVNNHNILSLVLQSLSVLRVEKWLELAYRLVFAKNDLYFCM